MWLAFIETQLFLFEFSVDSCKKRWKYLRERYVQQKKLGDSPSYEHLSRPYLEKMKFLDQFIQSRKSYRQVGLFTSPSQTMHAFDGNESSKSNSSVRLDDAFQQYYHLNQFPHANLVVKSEENASHSLDLHKTETQANNNNMPSSSSSLVSQESPATLLSNSTTHEIEDASVSRKRRRTTSSSINDHNGSQHNINSNHMERTHDSHQQQILNNNLSDNEDQNSINNDNASDQNQSSPNHSIPTEFLYPLYEQNTARARKAAVEHLNATSSSFPNAADFLHPFYQQAVARQFRNSEQLLGELVTSELIKMSKDRKKIVQKKILEILFFDDDWFLRISFDFALVSIKAAAAEAPMPLHINYISWLERRIDFHVKKWNRLFFKRL